MRNFSLLFVIGLLLSFSLAAQTTLIPFGSEWKYLDDGSNQGTAWKAASFSDGSWKSGNGKFGYGISDAATQVSYGPDPDNKYVTTYFRKSISIADKAVLSDFKISALKDDGIIVYVNGTAVWRTGFPSGPVHYNTLAYESKDNGKVIHTVSVGATPLKTGTNVVAVEVHQAALNSPDMVFDLQLTAKVAGGDVTAPTVLSINRQSPTTETTTATSVTYRATFSEAVTGVDAADFAPFAVSGSATGTVSGVTAASTDGTAYDVTVSSVTVTGTMRLDLKGSGTGIADAAGNAISGGYTSGQTYIIQLTDATAPAVLSINRQNPTTETTTATSVTYRATFSEAVTGVDMADFATTVLSGSLSSTISGVTAVSTSAYDVTVSSISGTGTLRLDLKDSGTGIADAAGNPIGGGYTSGKAYTIDTTTPGFTSITNLSPVSISTTTGEKPQSKVWSHAGRHWAVIPNSSGTFLWRLDGTTWTSVLRLSPHTSSKADCKVVGDITHIFLYQGASSQFVSVEYVPSATTYQLWSRRTNTVGISFESGVETATIDMDGNGRLWLASAGVSDINVRWSDSPYNTWSAPIAIATGVKDDDICAVIALPGRIGVFWSNQNTKRFGFKTHTDGASPSSWSVDEVPASQSALNIGSGMADDHLNMSVASDGTLYSAVKTGYDNTSYPEIALLVRRPTGTWHNLYEVSRLGTRPVVILNETIGRVRVIYTYADGGGDIVYKESSTSSIAFSAQRKLISGTYNNTTSTKDNFTSEVVILASGNSQAVGVLARDGEALIASSTSALSGSAEVTDGSADELLAYPNPFTSTATLKFALPEAGEYTLGLYDSKGAYINTFSEGIAGAEEQRAFEVDGSGLARGLYLVRLQTKGSVRTLRLMLNK